jgi:hypothetical protein
LWLMSRGSYSVYVTVQGARGSGTAIVPVTSFATARLGLSRPLAAILIVLGAVLFAGLVTIIRAASGEALLELGQAADHATRRRARTATFVAAPVLGLLAFGGARWWGAVDDDYRRTMYRPPAVDVSPEKDDEGTSLSLRVHDTAAFHAIFAPVIPDHGKMMHLFVVREGAHDVFGHFHPSEIDSLHFRTRLAGLPAGRYRLFGDIVLANGLSQTVTNTFDWRPDGSRPRVEDADDAILSSAAAAMIRAAAPARIGAGYSMAWAGKDGVLPAGTPVDLSFEVRDDKGTVVPLHPYMGMNGHAVVLRDDESVFVHLHPMGTVAISAQSAFAARDRGDTTSNGKPLLAVDSVPSGMTAGMSTSGRLSFPYEFPRPGHYRIWVQVKPNEQVMTGVYDVVVR